MVSGGKKCVLHSLTSKHTDSCKDVDSGRNLGFAAASFSFDNQDVSVTYERIGFLVEILILFPNTELDEILRYKNYSSLFPFRDPASFRPFTICSDAKTIY